VVGQTTVCKRDVVAFFKDHDFSEFIEATSAGSKRGATSDAPDNNEFHGLLNFFHSISALWAGVTG